MFTGMVEARARVLSLNKTEKGARLTLRVPASFSKLRLGSSVCVSGACLTVSARSSGKLSFDLLKETMKCTIFENLNTKAELNLERALRWKRRIEGHFVQGHVDGTGRVLKVLHKPRQESFQVSFPRRLKRYFVTKGSVAVNGVSLTIGNVRGNTFWVHVVPMTLKKTNLGQLQIGNIVNLEADILLKFFRRLTSPQSHYKLAVCSKKP